MRLNLRRRIFDPEDNPAHMTCIDDGNLVRKTLIFKRQPLVDAGQIGFNAIPDPGLQDIKIQNRFQLVE